ncbi:hemerythrin [Thiorhodococcus mannitoliphagus]|uniref:Hemerythrin n=1 Tax=Thiorhodococcus mannitoliphagus TaxID=329406 RepID=A0A6P1DQE2_9GAMM|nr:hemerythrin domain-containing protein [Thiorhodococcus mannitoliphagus]NEX20497.1 hemerythrin [Thiorhodococcus mannitoliphagus]
MPKLLTWREDWSLHIEALDRDHRALIDLFADICIRFCPEASSGRCGDANALMDALTYLGESMREHFRREEDFMRGFDYEGIGEHQSEHALLMAEFTAMLREWRAEGMQVFDGLAQGLVRDWLLAHILGADRSFAEAYSRLCGREDDADYQRTMSVYQSSYRTSLVRR